MPHGLTPDQLEELIERYDDVFSDMLEYEGIEQAEDAIANAGDSISDAGGDAYEVLDHLLAEREEAHAMWLNGLDVDWDVSDYDEYDLDDEWFYYH